MCQSGRRSTFGKVALYEHKVAAARECCCLSPEGSNEDCKDLRVSIKCYFVKCVFIVILSTFIVSDQQ